MASLRSFDSNHLIRVLIKNAPIAIAMVDRDMTYLFHSDRWKKDHGLLIDVVGMNHYDVFPNLSSAARLAHQRCLEGISCPSGEERVLRENGQFDWLRCEALPWYESPKTPGGLILMTQIVTQHKATQSQAWHDTLTGLLNRFRFAERVQEAIESCRQTNSEAALIFLDLDNFQLINDSCGYPAGDYLLLAVANRLRMTVRSFGTLARLGGDEFGILLSNTPFDQARSVAEQIRLSISAQAFHWDDTRFRLHASIGMTRITPAIDTSASAFSAANFALKTAKDSRTHEVELYEPSQDTTGVHWVPRLHRAIHQGLFQLWRQDIFPLQSQEPSHHAEILLRMLDGQGGSISPGVFMPTAERYQLIQSIDRWVVDAFFNSDSVRDKVYAINLSPISIGDREFGEQLIATLKRVAPTRSLNCLCFEMTETAIITDRQLKQARYLMSAIRDLGCRLAIDDFGAGASNFWCLDQFQFDYLKIDGSLIQPLIDPDGAINEKNYQIVKAINSIGHAIGIKTVAEFVKNEQILQVVKQIGVDYGQGFHLAAPIAGLR